jgi:hypothetical protein
MRYDFIVTSSSNTEDNSPILSILVIATKGYINYANDLIDSVSKNMLIAKHIEVIIFCDKPDAVKKVQRPDLVVKCIEIPALGWPDATLLRYKIFYDHREQMTGKIVMYLDADTLVVAPITEEILSCTDWLGGVALVQHPGYFKRNIFWRLLIKSAIGPWENRKNSHAFVPLHQRKNYVCGGVWMGFNREIIDLCRDLSQKVDQDQLNQIVAKHHDESHLNSWKNNHAVSLLTPRWAFARHYRNLSGIDPLIEVVHKPEDWVKEPVE